MSDKIKPVDEIPPVTRGGKWKEILEDFVESDTQYALVREPTDTDPQKKRTSLDMAIRNMGIEDEVQVNKRGKDVYLAKVVD